MLIPPRGRRGPNTSTPLEVIMVIYFIFFFVCACARVLGMADDCCFLILGGVALSNVSSANMSSAKKFLLNRRFSLALVFWVDLEASKRNYHSSRVLNRGSVEIYASISILFFFIHVRVKIKCSRLCVPHSKS